MMQTMKKKFDCVAMMHAGQADVLKKLEGMSDEEQILYWHKKTEKLRARQRDMRPQSVTIR